MTRVFESNGPDIKIRGTASHVAEKYVQLARDARSSGDPVAAENYYQHAEHYFRLIAAAQEQFRQNQPQPRTDNEMPSEDGDDESENFSQFRAGARLRSGAAAAVHAAREHQRDTSARASPTSRVTSISRASTTRIATIARSRNFSRSRNPSRSRCQRRPAAVVHHRTAAADQWRSINNGGFEGNGGERFPPAAAVGRTARGPKAWRRRRRATISIRGTSKRPSSASRSRGAYIHECG